MPTGREAMDEEAKNEVIMHKQIVSEAEESDRAAPDNWIKAPIEEQMTR